MTTRLEQLVSQGHLTPDEAAEITAAPRVLERLEILSSVDRRGALRLVRVARAWERDRVRTEAGRPRPHFARYSPAIVDAIEPRIGDSKRILDPLAGTLERLAVLEQPDRGWHQVFGVELEPEWVEGYSHPRLVQGDATKLPFPDHSFDVICVSPSYGNRDSDRTGGWWDNPDRKTYAAALGRNPTPVRVTRRGNVRGSLCLPFSHPLYRAGHALVWAETVRVLKPDGMFVIVLKNFIAGGAVNRVSQWHRDLLRDGLGLREVDDTSVSARGRRIGANATVRAEQVDKIYISLRPPEAGELAARLSARVREENLSDS